MAISKEVMVRAKLVASILTDNGIAVNSPDEATLDDVERARWDVCVRIVRCLNMAGPFVQRLAPTDSVPSGILDLVPEQYPYCPDCAEETDLISSREGRRWICDCGWEGALSDGNNG